MNTDDKICAICYENEEEEKLIKLEPCCHEYHKSCMKEYIKIQNIFPKCPSCREEVTNLTESFSTNYASTTLTNNYASTTFSQLPSRSYFFNMISAALEPSSFNCSFLTTGGPSSINTRSRNANNQFDERELLLHQDKKKKQKFYFDKKSDQKVRY